MAPEITIEEQTHYKRLALAVELFDRYEPLRLAEDLPVELEMVLAQGGDEPPELRAQIAEAQAACRRFDAALTEALSLIDSEGS